MAVNISGNLAEAGTSPQAVVAGPDFMKRLGLVGLQGPLNLFTRPVVGFGVGAGRATAHHCPGW